MGRLHDEMNKAVKSYVHKCFEFVVVYFCSLRRCAADQEMQGNDGEDVSYLSLYILASKAAPTG